MEIHGALKLTETKDDQKDEGTPGGPDDGVVAIVVDDDEQAHDRSGERQGTDEGCDEEAQDEDQVWVDGWRALTRIPRRHAQ